MVQQTLVRLWTKVVTHTLARLRTIVVQRAISPTVAVKRTMMLTYVVKRPTPLTRLVKRSMSMIPADQLTSMIKRIMVYIFIDDWFRCCSLRLATAGLNWNGGGLYCRPLPLEFLLTMFLYSCCA